jgi:protein TonB
MFEHSLIGLEERKKSRRGWFSLPAAIAIHLAAFATFTFASYWDVADVPAPPTNDIFYVALPPPPPPPALGSGRQETRTTPVRQEEVKPPTPVQQPVQPTDEMPDLPPANSHVANDVLSDLQPGGDPHGVKEGGVSDGGVTDGTPFSNGTDEREKYGTGAPDPQPADNEPIVVGGAVLKPEILVKTQPRYTELARRSNTTGVVVLRAVIDERGNVTNLEVLRTLPMGLEQAAVDAVRTWRFKPATLHGRPVKVYFNLTVNFQIQR